MRNPSLVHFVLAGCLAYSSSCTTVDPIKEQQVNVHVEQIKKGIFPKQTTVLYETSVKEALKDNLEKLLNSEDWEKVLSWSVTSGFVDKDDMEVVIKKILGDKNSVVLKEGRIAEILVRCRTNGYDVMKDDEGRELFLSLLKAGYSCELRYVKTLLADLPDGGSEFLGNGIRKLITTGDYCEAGFLACQILASSNSSLPLTKEEFYLLGQYYENDWRKKDRERPFTTTDREPLKSDLETAERLYCAGLSAKGNKSIDAKLITNLVTCIQSQLSLLKDPSLVQIKEVADHLWKLPIEKDNVASDALVRCMQNIPGENRLECIIQQGFRPSKNVVEEYCVKILKSNWNFEDVLFFISKYGNSLPSEAYVGFGVRVLGINSSTSLDVFSATKALELAKENKPDVAVPMELFLDVEKRVVDSTLDLTSISRLWSILSGKNYWREEKYKERQNLLAFKDCNGLDEKRKKLCNLVQDTQLIVDITKIAYHTHLLDLECSRDWLNLLSFYLSTSPSDQQARFKQELSKSLEAKKYLQFVGDIAVERGDIALAYSFWSNAEFESGMHYLKKKYSELLKVNH